MRKVWYHQIWIQNNLGFMVLILMQCMYIVPADFIDTLTFLLEKPLYIPFEQSDPVQWPRQTHFWVSRSNSPCPEQSGKHCLASWSIWSQLIPLHPFLQTQLPSTSTLFTCSLIVRSQDFQRSLQDIRITFTRCSTICSQAFHLFVHKISKGLFMIFSKFWAFFWL